MQVTLARKCGALLLLVCLVVLLGCSKVTDRSEVIGTYEARHDNGVEILQLRPDGTYIRIISRHRTEPKLDIPTNGNLSLTMDNPKCLSIIFATTTLEIQTRGLMASRS